MTQAARQLRTDPDDKWLPIKEAAELTGLSESAWIRRAHGEVDAAFDSGRTSRAVKRVPPEGGKPTWFVHRSMHQALRSTAPPGSADEREALSLRERYPEHAVEEALQRWHWLQEWRGRYQRRRSGETERSLAAEVVKEARRHGVKFVVSTLQLWHRQYRANGLEALIDQRSRPADANQEGERSLEAIDYFYQCYRVESKPSIRLCHDMTLREAGKRGWKWARSCRATSAWLEAHDDKRLTCLMRDGQTLFAHKYLPHVERTYANLEPGELFVSDHHQLDAFVWDGRRRIRPWICGVQDARTRCIVGWSLAVTPSSDSIIRALRMAFREWAIPKKLKIDNGKDFGSKVITGSTKKDRAAKRRNGDDHVVDRADSRFLGIAGELGIKVTYCIPFAPWGKGPKERFFGTLAGQCAKQFPTYCGNSTATKPECLEELKETNAPTMEEASAIIRTWLDVYHRSEHRFEHVTEVPLTTWQSATSLRRAGEKELDFLMDARGVYRVTANGVGFMAAGKHWTYRSNSMDFRRYIGRDVFITQDPEDMSCCIAWTTDRSGRRFIARLEPNVFVPEGSTTEQARAIIADKKREQSIMGKAKRCSARRTQTFAQRMQEHNRELRRKQLATGTDGKATDCTIVPVRTGFEGASIPTRIGVVRDEKWADGLAKAQQPLCGLLPSANDTDDEPPERDVFDEMVKNLPRLDGSEPEDDEFEDYSDPAAVKDDGPEDDFDLSEFDS